MSKTTANNTNDEKPNKSEKVPNKLSIPDTLAGCYAQAWRTLFNKLTKEEQDKLTKNLKAPEETIRGKVVTYSNVNSFVKNVSELGEELFEKRQKRKTPKKSG